MDQFTVDIKNDEAYIGDVVTLIGKDGESAMWDYAFSPTFSYGLQSPQSLF